MRVTLKIGSTSNFYFICLMVNFFCRAAFSVTADFVIIESPRSLSIYDQFEQPLSKTEGAGLLPYSPLQIMSADVRLGDQITRAMQCSYGQKTYYLLKDEQGTMLGDKDRIQIVKGCSVIGDTVEVSRKGAVSFAPSVSALGSAKSLPEGTILVLAFRSKNSYYALQTGHAPRFGWIPASSRDAWKPLKRAASADTSITTQTTMQLSERIEWANAHYKRLFDAFNRGTNMQKSIPRWQKTGDLTWSLGEPYGRTGELDESAKCLIEDLGDILIGKQFSVRYEKGIINISPKTLP